MEAVSLQPPGQAHYLSLFLEHACLLVKVKKGNEVVLDVPKLAGTEVELDLSGFWVKVFPYLQELDLLAFHQKVETHQDDPVAAQALHRRLRVDHVAVLRPQFDQKAEVSDFREGGEAGDDLAVANGWFVADGEVELIDMSDLEGVKELLLLELDLQERDSDLLELMHHYVPNPLSVPPQHLLTDRKQQVHCIFSRPLPHHSALARRPYGSEVDVELAYDGKGAPDRPKCLVSGHLIDLHLLPDGLDQVEYSAEDWLVGGVVEEGLLVDELGEAIGQLVHLLQPLHVLPKLFVLLLAKPNLVVKLLTPPPKLLS